MVEEIISVRGLFHRYQDGTQAVRGVGFSVMRGEIVSLIGPSGGGKSTILRCLNGLVKPSGGEVRFLGSLVRYRRDDLMFLRKRIGMVFQEFNLIPNLSVLMNVLIGRLSFQSYFRQAIYSFTKKDREVAIKALAKVGIQDLARKKARELSGGQKQRVGIARALAQEPVLLLADEPVSNLDPVTAERVLAHFVKLCREENLTAIINLHSVELAQKYCDRIMGVKAGQVIFVGRKEELQGEVLNEIYRDETSEQANAG